MKIIARAVALFSASSGIGTATQVVKGKLSAVFLGAEGFGVLGQLTNMWSMAHAVSGLALFNGIVQRIASGVRDGDQALIARQFSTILVFLTAFSCFTSIAGAILAAPVARLIFGGTGDHAWLVALILLSVPLGVTSQVYRSLLTGHAMVTPVVRAQIAADLSGMAVFVPMLFLWGLPGAVGAFVLMQLFKLAFQMKAVAAAVGRSYVIPEIRLFDWAEVRTNLGFGINGILMQVMSIGTSLMLMRMIISLDGLESAGVYNAAWKVASLYFGAIYAAAGGYFVPMLVAAKNNEELASRVDETARLYLYMLPPIVIGILSLAPEILVLLFSREFRAGSEVLALMLPADLLRITAETVGLVYLAKRRLAVYSLLYAIWGLMFLTASYFMLAHLDLFGVAAAYLVAYLVNLAFILVLARRDFGIRLPGRTLLALVSGFLACILVGLALLEGLDWVQRLAVAVLAGCIWLAISWRDEAFRELVSSVRRRIAR